MKLFIADGNVSQAAYRRLFERVKENDSPRSFHIFLVPDRYTLGVERDLVKYCFPNGYARADVQSFTRFAVKNVGKKIDACLSKEGTVILLRKVLQRTETRYYKKLFGYEFAKELFAAIASLRTAGITPDDILAEAENTDGVLGDKLHDIALVAKGYEEEIAGRFSDTVTRVDALENYLLNADLSDTHFYVLGFSIYSVQQLRVIRTLVSRAASVNLSYVRTCGGERCPGEQVEKLIAACRDEGIPVETDQVTSFVDPGFEYLRQSVFNPHAEVADKKVDAALFCEESPYDEILAAAREIRYLVREENYRYRDIAVVNNDPDYLPILRETFERCDIPVFIDDGYAFSESLAAKFVYALLAAAEYRTDIAFFKLARHPYLGLSVDESENFVRYCKKYAVRYRRFSEPFVLGECAVAEEVRKRVMRYVSALPEVATAKEYGEILTRFLSEEGVVEVTKRYEQSPDERDVAISVVDPLVNFLEEFGALADEEKFEIFEYASTMATALSDKKTVLRPAVVDAVFVGNTKESRFDDVKAAFFVGCTEENFPQKSGDGLIFSAFDNEAMRQKNMTVFPSPVERNALERFVLRDLIGKVQKRIYFGCSETALDGSAQTMGDGMEEMAFWTKTTPKRLIEYHDFSKKEELTYFLVNDKNARYEYLSGRLGDRAEAVERYLVARGLVEKKEPATEDYRYPFVREADGYVKTSVSQLETYFTCPFKYFMSYGLGVWEEEDATLKPKDFGIAIHNVLETFFRENAKRIDEKEDFSKEIDDAINREYQKEDYRRFLEDPTSRYFIEESKKECKKILPALIENMRHAKFRPMGYEVAFGYRKGEDLILLSAKGKIFKVVGKVDRVDEYDRMVAVVDYKTGRVESKLSDVFYGKKIQLYVYMKHFMNLGYEPAGAFYLPIRGGAVSGGRRYAMVGQIKRDVDVYYAFDDRAEDYREKKTFYSDNLDIGLPPYTKEGTRNFNAKTKNAVTKEEFASMVDYVRLLSERALAEISEGYSEKKPYEEKDCDYCPYNRICGKVKCRVTPPVENAQTFVQSTGGENG